MGKAVVVGLPRSATTLVCEALGQHPSILAFGEIFHHEEEERLRCHELGTGECRCYPGPDGLEAYLAHLCALTSAKGRDWLSFKLMDYQEPKLWRLLAADPSFRLIYTKRDNPLEALVSSEIGHQTNVWHARREEQRDRVKDVRVSIRCEKAAEYFRRDKAFEGRLRALSNPILTLRYSFIARDFPGAMGEVFDFLQVPREEVRPTQVKVAQKSLAERVVNFDELRARFAGTEWEVHFQ
jgi:hypothetical protein